MSSSDNCKLTGKTTEIPASSDDRSTMSDAKAAATKNGDRQHVVVSPAAAAATVPARTLAAAATPVATKEPVEAETHKMTTGAKTTESAAFVDRIADAAADAVLLASQPTKKPRKKKSKPPKDAGIAAATLADVVLSKDETEYSLIIHGGTTMKTRLKSIKNVPVNKISRSTLVANYKRFGKSVSLHKISTHTATTSLSIQCSDCFF